MRDKSIDATAGLLILFMIYGHIMSWTGLTETQSFVILDRVFCFFMPWFFYKAGMFYKQTKFENICIGGYRRLLIPYIVWGGVGIATQYLPPVMTGDVTLGHVILVEVKSFLLSGKIEGNSAIWFLLSLFIVRIAWHFLEKINRLAVVVAILIIVSIVVFTIKQRLPLMYYPEYLYNALLGATFFSLGVLMKEKQYQRSYFYISVLVYLLLLFIEPSRVDFFHTKVIEGNFALWMIQSSCGIIIINNVSKMCISFSNILQYVGFNSMVYLVIHFVIANVVRLLATPFELSSYIMALVYCIAILMLTPIIVVLFNKNRNKWIIGL